MRLLSFFKPSKRKILFFLLILVLGISTIFISLVFMVAGFLSGTDLGTPNNKEPKITIIGHIIFTTAKILGFPVLLISDYLFPFGQEPHNLINTIAQSQFDYLLDSPYIEITALLILLPYWYFLACFIDFLLIKLKKKKTH